MSRNLTIFMTVLLILLVPGESIASLIRTFLNFATVDHPKDKAFQIPPSQSPDPSIGLDSGGGGGDNFGGEGRDEDEHAQMHSNYPKAELIVSITNERCNMSLTRSCRELNNITGCLQDGGAGPEESFLIVQNDEDTPVTVNLTILPSNSTFKEIELQKHQGKKINVSQIIGGNQLIVLNAGNGNCTIHIRSPAPVDNSGKNIRWVATSVNPMHGAYVVFLTVLVGGGAWACFKLRRRGCDNDGVPYQELEMGQLETISAVNVETVGGWDEDWDDDWDEEKAVKMPGGQPLRHGKTNGNGIASG